MLPGPVLLESIVKLAGTPGRTLPFSRPGPNAFTFEASAGPSPLPPETFKNMLLAYAFGTF